MRRDKTPPCGTPAYTDSKNDKNIYISFQDRRGSRVSMRPPSRQASQQELRPHSPSPGTFIILIKYIIFSVMIPNNLCCSAHVP